MGISGLLPVLKSITENKSIDQYKGQTLAIDGYCWLHRAIYSCSQEICLGEDTDKYIVYFIDRVRALQQHGIEPFVVFDGGPLPMKQGTEDERRQARAKNRELGLASLRQQKYTEARKYFVRAADVTPYMAHRVIRELRVLNVQYVVAPYEADAQLAFLSQQGLVDGVITEDSDCLPFGCANVLFKMDRDGIAQEVQLTNLPRNEGLQLHMFTHDMFLEMCILSGCDYLASLPGFGLKKAYALVKQHGTYTKILRALRMEGKVRIPVTYEAEFERAVLTFRHQRVYNPQTKELVPLTPVPQELLDKDSSLDFLGPMIPPATAQAIAEGDVDPITHEPFANPPSTSRPQYAAHTMRPPSAPVQAKTDSNGFIHRKSSGFKSPTKTAPKTTNRNLPAWMSRKASQLSAKTPSPPPASAPSAAPKTSTPKTISHFFAARHAKFSPTEETVKTAAPPTAALTKQQSSESTYESQDPGDVDVARSISFSPLNDTVKHMRHDGIANDNKENAAPNTRPSTENAFARMMRAGSIQQKRSLKRKGPSGFGLGGRPRTQETPMERIKRLAFHAQSTTNPSKPGNVPIQQSAPDGDTNAASEPDSEPLIEESQQQESEFQKCGEQSTVPHELGSTESIRVASDKPVATVDAFSRFRFGAT